MLVTRFYDAEGGSRVTGGSRRRPVPGLVVTVEPVAVDAASRGRDDEPSPSTPRAPTCSTGRTADAEHSGDIGSPTGLSEVRFPAGTVLGQYEATIGWTGSRPTTRSTSTRVRDSRRRYLANARPTGQSSPPGRCPWDCRGRGGVNGWDATLEMPTEMLDGSFNVEFTFQAGLLDAGLRSALLALAVVLAAWPSWSGSWCTRRKQCGDRPSCIWTAALLFALPALRNFMPNVRPSVQAIDIYVYLWVMVAAVVAAGSSYRGVGQSGRLGSRPRAAAGVRRESRRASQNDGRRHATGAGAQARRAEQEGAPRLPHRGHLRGRAWCSSAPR